MGWRRTSARAPKLSPRELTYRNRETSKPSLLPAASHKTALFRNRFNVIHQRLLRNESFQTSAVSESKDAVVTTVLLLEPAIPQDHANREPPRPARQPSHAPRAARHPTNRQARDQRPDSHDRAGRVAGGLHTGRLGLVHAGHDRPRRRRLRGRGGVDRKGPERQQRRGRHDRRPLPGLLHRPAAVREAEGDTRRQRPGRRPGQHHRRRVRLDRLPGRGQRAGRGLAHAPARAPAAAPAHGGRTCRAGAASSSSAS